MEASSTSTTIETFILNPKTIIIVLFVVVAFAMIITGLGGSGGSGSGDDDGGDLFSFGSSSDGGMFSFGDDDGGRGRGSSGAGFGNIFAIIIIAVVVILASVHALRYFFSINVSALFTPNKTLDIVVDQTAVMTPSPAPVPEIKFKKQVFNIPGNYYTYDNARAVCNAYGADLATYDQVEKAYNKGAEWCNYGWSANQLALFPTQQQTYNTLQGIDGHQNDCGRPGINGGYIANPQVRFGVNCYGNKPKITQEEDELMQTANPYPQTAKDIAFQQQVDYWKGKVDEILVSPFNSDKWSS